MLKKTGQGSLSSSRSADNEIATSTDSSKGRKPKNSPFSWFSKKPTRPKNHQISVVKPSAPPEPQLRFLEDIPVDWTRRPEDESHQPSIEVDLVSPIAFYVTASLTLNSRIKIGSVESLLSKLEMWIDHYSGSAVMYPYYTLIYILLGSKLSNRPSNSKMFLYSSNFSGVIKFGYPQRQGKPPSETLSVLGHEGRDSNYVSIRFDATMKESNRNGVIYSQLYRLNGYNFPFPAALDTFNLNIGLTHEGLIGPSP